MKPNERDPVADRLFGGLEPPEPPRMLRGVVLTRARKHLQMGTHPDVWSRLWNHRGLRLAWAAAVVLLLTGHILATPSGVLHSRSVDPSLFAEQRVDEYLVGLLRPIRISENVQPMVGLVADSDDLTELDLKGNPS